MVKVLIGNLLESKSQTLVNTVNCAGVMGKGIALEFKHLFPDMYKDYVIRCKREDVKLGQPYLYRTLVLPWVLNFPTKEHWRSVTNLTDVVRGLEYLIDHYKEWGITSLACPPLGCGYGQLEWRVVGPTLYRYLRQLEIPVELYAPFGSKPEEISIDYLEKGPAPDQPTQQSPKWIRPGWVALVEVLNRLCQYANHRPVGRTTFQTIAFVTSLQGLPLEMTFRRGAYGPYSPEFAGMCARLLNNGMLQERVAGSLRSLSPGPTHEDALVAFRDELDVWEVIIDRVSTLFLKMDTRRAELVGAVMFCARELSADRQSAASVDQLVHAVTQWRPKVDPERTRAAVGYLAAQGWLSRINKAEDVAVENYSNADDPRPNGESAS